MVHDPPGSGGNQAQKIRNYTSVSKLHLPESKVIRAKKYISGPLIFLGNSLTTIGFLGLLLAASGLIQPESFAVGISSGVRVIGSVAIAGCLLSAIGYGVVEYFE